MPDAAFLMKVVKMCDTKLAELENDPREASTERVARYILVRDTATAKLDAIHKRP